MNALTKILAPLALVALMLPALQGCANLSQRQQNAAIGAGVGAIGGSILTGGSAAGTVGGAVVGGVIGNQVNKP